MPIRLKIFIYSFLLLFLLLIVRLFYWQVIKGEELSGKARLQYQGSYTIDALRGEILSSDGGRWVSSGEAYLMYASIPDLKEPPKLIAEKLAPEILDVEETDEEYKESLLKKIDRIYKLLTRESVVWVPLEDKISPEAKESIEELNIEGIGFEMQERRVYPESSSAAQLLGFVGKNDNGEDKGYFGLEGFYDLPLSGKPGFLSRESDAMGVPILFGSSREVSAIKGVDLLTNVDKSIQLRLERDLKEGIEKFGASAGTAIVMNPKSGAILAMSSYPSYDPQDYSVYSDELFKNPAISDSFEPGSVFKVVVMASALEAGAVEPDTNCDICEGPVRVDKYSIETWNNEYHPDSSMTDVIVHSDNVGMVFVAQKLGVENMYEYIKRFGFGSETGIDLQGEASPRLRDKDSWSNVDLATSAFGQGIAVTPIQLIRAVSAIANKGKMPTPQVVDEIAYDGIEEDIPPQFFDNVISEKAAREITSMMVEAAKNGEAKWTHLRGFKVAGKTGTAQIPIAGHYDAEKTIASFIGFAPYDDPKFIMLVTLREPSTSPWASETAAPLWYSIAKDLFLHFGIQPEG